MSAPTAPEARKKRVLVAEDDPAIAGMLVKVLGQHYEVVHAATGIAAVELAVKQPHPALLLLDVMMPGMDGYQVAARIRAIPQLKAIPIIFLTAKAAPGDVIRGIQHGAKHYIQKPFKIEEVVAKVKKTLGE
ncbi:MAG TPA: response regulator transcription factor [Polyangiaceae bacterium]|nr:response regulator transcription factor [Polyangiaceae bacterium]